MKKLIIVLLSFIITSCSFKYNKIQSTETQSSSSDISTSQPSDEILSSSGEVFSQKNKKNIKYTYPLDGSMDYKRDDSLSVNRMLFTYPSEVTAKDSSPYAVDDFRNLDYSKDLCYEYLNFRIPQRAQVFSKASGLYAIDFPKNKDMSIRIYFKKIFDDSNENQVVDTALGFMDSLQEEAEVQILQKPYKISSDQMDACYFISQKGNINHTYLFVKAPKNILVFDLVEDRDRSDVSKYLMSDLLSTMYIETEDPINVKKNFESYSKDMELFATEKVDFDSFSLNIPKNMKNLQDDNDFKAFASEKNGNILSYVLIIRSPKASKEGQVLDLGQVFDQTSGSSFTSAYIVGMGSVKEEKIKESDALSSEIRIYMDNSTSEGVKTSIETNDDFITLIVTGPLANSNETKLLNKNILNSLEIN